MKKLRLVKRIVCGLCDLVTAAAIFSIGCIVGSRQGAKQAKDK